MDTKIENKLILGDCLEVLKTIPADSVDLCYIDPPFFSNKNYEVIWGDSGEIASFNDRWSGGMESYISWLYERVKEIYRVLKPSGSFYLHCDWHADAYIRVKILDELFGSNNFKGHIIWQRNLGHALARGFDIISDSIFLYAKNSELIKFNQITKKLSGKELEEKFPHIEKETGRRFQHNKLEQTSNKYNKSEKRIIQGKEVSTNLGWRWSQETIEERLSKNPHLIYWTESGRPRYKTYADEYEGTKISNLWTDIMPLSSISSERIGYPTQKPEALLERIIKASSNEGDVVLDCFCGGGTTSAVAKKLKRKFIAVDQSIQAIKITQERLNRDADLLNNESFKVITYKYDYDVIKNMDAFEFQKFIIEQFGGEPNVKQRGDLGIDGFKKMDGLNVPIQVKRSENIGRDAIDNFMGAIIRYHKRTGIKAGSTAGYIIAFSFGKGAIAERARLNREEKILIEFIEVKDIIPIGYKPKVNITFKWKKTEDDKKEITFKAESEDKNKKLLYQWDFNYDEKKGFKAKVLRDIEGVQVELFKNGTYNIALKATETEINNEKEKFGAEAEGIIEKVVVKKLKVDNDGVEF